MFTIEKVSRGTKTILSLLVVGFILSLFYVEDAEARGRRRFRRGGRVVRRVPQRVIRQPRFVSRVPSRGFSRGRRVGRINNNRILANAPSLAVANNNNNFNDLDIFGSRVGGFSQFNNGIGNNALLAQQLAGAAQFTPTFAVDGSGRVVELNPQFLGRVGNEPVDPTLLGAAAANNGILPASVFPGGVIPQQAIRQNVVIGSNGQIMFGESQAFLPQSAQNVLLINQGGVPQAVQAQVIGANPVVSFRR